MKDKADGSMATMSIPDAGRKYYGLGRAASYEAAAAGFIPTVPCGPKLKRVPVAAMEEVASAVVAEAVRHAAQLRQARTERTATSTSEATA